MSVKDWTDKDYYKVLGVGKDASADEIRKAFRKIARENHPDQHPGDKAAESRFKEASEANSILTDSKKRKEYDEARRFSSFRFPRGGSSGGGGGGSVDDLFRNASAGGGDLGDIFGGLFNRGGRAGGPTPNRGRRGADVEGEVTLDFAEAIDGKTVPIQMVSTDACSACHGTGAKSGSVPTVCLTCQGSGMLTMNQNGSFSAEPCPDCGGRGLVVEDPCPVCTGSGRAKSTRTMQVRIPAGVNDGQRIRLKGKGGAGENGGPNGDLFVIVHVRPHKVFGRSGTNLTVTVPLTFAEAALGADIDVPTLKGAKVRMKIPAGTPAGRTFRARGKGVPKKDGTPGDLLVTVEVQVPTKLTDKAAEALRAYAKAADEPDPRAGM